MFDLFEQQDQTCWMVLDEVWTLEHPTLIQHCATLPNMFDLFERALIFHMNIIAASKIMLF